MKRYFQFSLVYLVFAIAIVLLFRNEPSTILGNALSSALDLTPAYLLGASQLLLFAFVLSAFTRLQANRTMIFNVVAASFGTVFVQAAFNLIKTSIPYIIPFYADSSFASLDAGLHGGIDPWRIAHGFGTYLPMDWVLPIYLQVWGLSALLLPVLLAGFDEDKIRVRRIILVYLFAWIGLGNLIALAGSSVGPVFYDRLLGTDRFAALTEALVSSGVAAGKLGGIQDSLWRVYNEIDQSMGWGISAFPSVHVGVATVTGIYMFERSKWLAPLGVLFVSIILFLSIYTGYHYAMDGYVSILLVMLVWWILWRRDGRKIRVY